MAQIPNRVGKVTMDWMDGSFVTDHLLKLPDTHKFKD